MRKLALIIILFSLGAGLVIVLTSQKAVAPTHSTTNLQTDKSPMPVRLNKQLYSTTDAKSLWVVVNKSHSLSPISYIPSDLTTPNVPLRVPGNESMQLNREAASLLEQMFDAAKKDGINLMLASGYRSYNYQVGLYKGYVTSSGQIKADEMSARPGHSEHQTGLAADIEPVSRNCETSTCFATTPEGKWLEANCYKYGYIIRYKADKVTLTGYQFEPWHIRYVGLLLSSELRSQNISTLEEFFNITGGVNY